MTMEQSTKVRIETDFLGSVEVQGDALYGIHAVRAKENFPNKIPFNETWYRAAGVVKKSCYLAYRKMKQATLEKLPNAALPFSWMDDTVIEALIEAASEVLEGKNFEHFIVPGIMGGAGTSINMNINEIIANRALQLLGKPPGAYEIVDPVEHANVFQSTNDAMPTALKLAVMERLDALEAAVNALRMSIEQKEKTYRDIPRSAFTQMQRAVPSSYGKLFGAYQEALSRDWWRVSKCFERIKVINLGGGATGSGLAIPKYFIFEVQEILRQETGRPLTRGDHLEDATLNLDPFVEVHGILKAHAVNLEKISCDLRAMASDAFGDGAVRIPARQVGSSIMPGKVNPVIAEYVISAAHSVYGHDIVIASLCGQGFLDLNAYLPSIGHYMLESLDLLISANQTLSTHLIDGLTVDGSASFEGVIRRPTTATALLPYIGYHNAEKLAGRMQQMGEDLFQAAAALNILDETRLRELLSPSRLLELGYRLSDISKAK
jgi:aspartate ammonia-lyase